MTKVVSLYSFRDGTGKSTVTANLAALIAKKQPRKKVGIIDTNLFAPGIRYLFQEQLEFRFYLNDYLWRKCDIQKIYYPVNLVSKKDNQEVEIYIIPCSPDMGYIAKTLNEKLHPESLINSFSALIDQLKLDYLLIDSPPGIAEENLLPISIADMMAVVFRPDKQDFQETSIALEIADKLGIPNKFIIANQVPKNIYNKPELRRELEEFAKERKAILGGILPQSELMLERSLPERLQSSPQQTPTNQLFSLDYPNDPWSEQLEKVAINIIERLKQTR